MNWMSEKIIFFVALALTLCVPTASAAPIAVVNASFEDPFLDNNNFTNNSVPGWLLDVNGSSGAGVFNISGVLPDGQAPEGRNTLYVNRFGDSVSQVLNASLTASTLYELRVEVVSRPNFGTDISGYSIELIAGETMLASLSSDVVNPAPGEFETAKIVFFADESHPALGESISIRFTAGVGQPNFDDVRLSATTCSEAIDCDVDGVLNKSDNCIFENNSDQLDTNSDGFGNACDADLNGDCVVNFLDLAALSGVFLTGDEDADLNGDGVVNFLDFFIMSNLFLLPPGPSGLVEACDVP